MVSNITETSVDLSWFPPDNLGIPELSYYQLIIATQLLTSNVILTTNSTSLLVNGLLPNTVYNISVVGVSHMLLGHERTIITITTLTGGK